MECVEHRAQDNLYFHPDFHCALNCALEYLRLNFGLEAVREYLRQFAAAYYAPLTAKMRWHGLQPLREHLESVYRLEGAKFTMAGDVDELRLEVAECPAVRHIRASGQTPSPAYMETILTVNEAICHATPFAFKLLAYNAGNGASCQYFYRR